MRYENYEHSIPEIVLNIPGELILENKELIKIRTEIDYNQFNEEEMKKIVKDKRPQFMSTINCKTFVSGKAENATYIPFEKDDQKYYKSIKTENHSLNFRFIKKHIQIFKNDTIVQEINLSYDKEFSLSLGDGEYTIRCNVYNIDNEFIKATDIKLVLKTNYFSLKDLVSDIPLELKFYKKDWEDQGNMFDPKTDDWEFKLKLSADSKKLYSFLIDNIETKKENIFNFSFYNPENDTKNTDGKIGARIELLNDKQIDEIIKNPIQEQLIKSKIVFNINELFTTERSKNDIGVIHFPTVRSKIKDNLRRYYDLKCDISQSYLCEIPENDLLVTDKFNEEPLFYKFLLNEDLFAFSMSDEDDNNVLFDMETLTDGLYIVYFNPLRNKTYYFTNNKITRVVNFKKTTERFFSTYKSVNNELKREFENPVYFGNLILKSKVIKECDVTIILHNYKKIKTKLKTINKDPLFLENNRLTINDNILSIQITGEFDEAINILSDIKNNNKKLTFLKKNNKDIVYLAKETKEINLKDLTDEQVNEFKYNKRYNVINDKIIEVCNGPLTLEPLNKSDFIFTDIETFKKEYSRSIKDIIRTTKDDEFFRENVVNNSLEIRKEKIDEDKGNY